jgi:hypothetical protein
MREEIRIMPSKLITDILEVLDQHAGEFIRVSGPFTHGA